MQHDDLNKLSRYLLIPGHQPPSWSTTLLCEQRTVPSQAVRSLHTVEPSQHRPTNSFAFTPSTWALALDSCIRLHKYKYTNTHTKSIPEGIQYFAGWLALWISQFFAGQIKLWKLLMWPLWRYHKEVATNLESSTPQYTQSCTTCIMKSCRDTLSLFED